MAKMEPLKQTDSVVNHFADVATILYYSPYKIFTVSFKVKYDTVNTLGPIKINHIAADVYRDRMVEFTIYNTVKFDTATVFTVRIPGIDLNSVIISNMINRSNPIFYL
jgi:4-hydroxyphenylpyruvate dioxygenase-like putative hemolysin